MAGGKQYCAQKIEGQTDYHFVQVKGVDNNRTKFADKAATENIQKDCKGTVHFSYIPEEYHLYSDVFPKLKPDLLEMQINKRFKDLGLTLDTVQFAHRAKQAADKNGRYNCIFTPENELIELLVLATDWKGVKKIRLIPFAAAVAGLLKKITEQCVLVFYFGTQSSQVVAVKNGVPLYNQSLAQSELGGVEEALIPNAVDFARLSLRKDHEIEEFHILATGPGRINVNLSELNLEEWQPNFDNIIELQDGQDLLDNPSLYGAAFSVPEYDFLPKGFSQSWLLQRISKRAAIIAFLAALVCAAGYFYLQPTISNQKAEYRNLTQELNDTNRALLSRLPNESELNNFERLLSIRKAAKNDFRLDDLARNLSFVLPGKVHVTNLEIRRQNQQSQEAVGMPPVGNNFVPPPDSSAAIPGMPGIPGMPALLTSLSTAEKLLKSNVTILITCTSKGNYQEITTRFEKSVAAINEVFNVAEMNWNFNEQLKAGTLICELTPKQEPKDNEL